MPAPFITVDPQPHPALSYDLLRAEALELLGRLCGEQWSDFNSHDPGITILEQLCFALTELAYRAEFPIEDLLASAGPDWQPGPGMILKGDPVTQEDLIAMVRSMGPAKVLVEAVQQPALPLYFRIREEGLGDLDLEPSAFPADQQRVIPSGIWRVAAQFSDGAPGRSGSSLLEVAKRLHGARLLGRDYELVLINPFQVSVAASLEVEPAGSAAQLMATIHHCLNGAIGVAANSADSHGLRSAILIKALQGLPEVRQVYTLALANDTNGPFHRWHLPLPDGGAILNPNSPIKPLRRGQPLEPKAADVKDAAASAPTSAPAGAGDGSPPAGAGRRRQLTDLHPVAWQLPAVYGVGQAGLPAGSTAERRTQARQLQTYLYFFDQLLANSQAQLALAPALLSPVDEDDPNPLDTYAVLVADNRDPDFARSRLASGDEQKAWLREALHSGTPGAASTNRAAFLAHLLSRFGEQLGVDQQLQGPAHLSDKELVRNRSEFLRRIALLSGGRGSGPDQLVPDPENTLATEAAQGVFAERLRRKLGLHPGSDGSPPLLVIEHLLLRPLQEDANQRVQEGEDPIPYLARVVRPDPWSNQVSVVINEDAMPTWSESFVARTLREELPAHLAGELYWFKDEAVPGKQDWSELLHTWHIFRAHLAQYRLATLGGGSPSDLLLALRLRDSRDRLISLLNLGLPWPLRDIPFDNPNPLIVATGQQAAIQLPFSQIGVRYQLIKADSGEFIDTDTNEWTLKEGSDNLYVEGTGQAITLTTPPISEDLSLRVKASVLDLEPTSPEWTSSGHRRITLLAGEIRVVEGIDTTLSLKLLDDQGKELPLLHPEGQARLASFGQTVKVQVENSQEGVQYELIDEAERGQPFSEQTTLSPAVFGNSGEIEMLLEAKATEEDRDLAVRASLIKTRVTTGQPSTSGPAVTFSDTKVLTAILSLRVMANPNVPLIISNPLLKRNDSVSVLIGADQPKEEASQSNVTYQLLNRPLGQADWLFDALVNEQGVVEVRDGDRTIRLREPDTSSSAGLEGFQEQLPSATGTGKSLTMGLSRVTDDLLVAGLAHKSHRISAIASDDLRTGASKIALKQVGAVLVRPDDQRPLTLQRHPEGQWVWELLGGQPGVSYTVWHDPGSGVKEPLAAPLHVHLRKDDLGGPRGLSSLRVAVDLVVAGSDEGPPRAEFNPNLADLQGLVVTARLLLSGLETTMASSLTLIKEPPSSAD